MKEYHKIETIFIRDMEGSKKLVEGKFRSKEIEYLKNNKWIFTEKIDGTNIRIHWDGHKVKFEGRTANSQIPSHLVSKLNELFGGNTNEEIFEEKFGETEVILFGEGYGTKIQNGGLYRQDVSFILFDVLINNVFLEKENCIEIAKSFNIEYVPIILEGTIEEAVNYVKSKPKSMIGQANMEGLVGRPEIELLDKQNNRIIVKIKVCDFE